MPFTFIDYVLITQLFVLLNPLSSFPFLVAAYYRKVSYDKKMDIGLIAIKSVVVAFVIAIVILFTGKWLFQAFNISVDAFRIAGGVVLLLLGIETVRAKKEDDHKVGGVDGLIAIIATPMLTGPATISYITIKSMEMNQMTLFFNMTLAFLLVGIIFYLFALVVPKINARVITICSKIMGLFLTAMAVEMIAKGLTGIIHAALASNVIMP